MIYLVRIIILAAGVLSLSGCQQLMSYSGGEGKSESAQKAAAPAKQNCNQWCHNGWCSTHCDEVVTTS